MNKLLLAIAICGLSLSLSAQQLPAPLNEGERIELLKELLEPQRQALLSEPKSSKNVQFPFELWMHVDPEWTAQFLLEQDDERSFRSTRVVASLVNYVGLIDDETILRLLGDSPDHWLSLYGEVFVDALPEGNADLEEKVVALMKRRLRNQKIQFLSVARLQRLAKRDADEKWLEEIDSYLLDFYASGAAAKLLADASKSSRSNETVINRLKFNLQKFAPSEFIAEFEHDPDIRNMRLQAFLFSQSHSLIEKRELLKKVQRYEFGKQPFQYMLEASRLGAVAELDHELALRWASEAPTEMSRLWARIRICPALALVDRGRARKMVHECYEQLEELSSSSTQQAVGFYGYPPAYVATAALPIVNQVDPELLASCIEKSRMLLSEFSEQGVSRKLFVGIAQLAEYDREAARKLLDASSASVNLSIAPSFFRALLAVSPEQVLEEYETLPLPTDGQRDYRVSVRKAISRALASKSDVAFWSLLNHQNAFERNAWIEVSF